MNIQERLHNIVESVEGIENSFEVTIHGIKCDTGKEIIKDMKWMAETIQQQVEEISALKLNYSEAIDQRDKNEDSLNQSYETLQSLQTKITELQQTIGCMRKAGIKPIETELQKKMNKIEKEWRQGSEISLDEVLNEVFNPKERRG